MEDLAFNENTDFFAYHNWFENNYDVVSNCVYKANHVDDISITIVIPTYKRAAFLCEALDSAIKQIGACNYFIIVVDNNPERGDETEILMEKYRNTCVSYYKNSVNIGMGGNWNRCIELVKSPWLVLLHDDDLISSVFIREISKAIAKFPNAGVIQTEKVTDLRDLMQDEEGNVQYIRRGKLDFYQGSRISGVPTGVAYRKDCAVSLGGFPYDKYQGYAYWFHVKCVERFPYYTIMAPLTFYRMSTQNASAQGELHETWIYYEYWLLRNMMKKNWVPHFIYGPYIQQHAKNQEAGLRAVWGSEFEFPDKYIKRINFPYWRYRLTDKYLRVYARLLRMIQI